MQHLTSMNVMIILTSVLRRVPILISTTPALVAQATGWQVMAMDVMVHVCCNYIYFSILLCIKTLHELDIVAIGCCSTKSGTSYACIL